MSMTPIIGLEGLVTAKLVKDEAGTLSYKAVEDIEGLVEVSIEDDSPESEAMYADNVEKFNLIKSARLRFTIELLAAEHQTIADFFGHDVNENGVVVKSDDDKPPYRAFGFRADDGGGGQDGIWLKKCRPVGRTNSQVYHTKEGENTTVQTVKVDFVAIPTIKDTEYQRKKHSTATGWATYFNTVPGGTVAP